MDRARAATEFAALTRVQPQPARAKVACSLAILAATVLCAACDRPADGIQAPAATETRVLRRGLGAEPGTLDPRLADDNAALAVVGDLYEGLTSETRDGAIVPGAAQAWTVDAGGLVYTFALRDDLRWSNGDPLTAQHFAAGLAAVLAPDSTAPGATLLEAVAGVDVVDDRTLRIRLQRPLPYLPALLAMPLAAPLHPATTGAGATTDRAPPRTASPTNACFRFMLSSSQIEVPRKECCFLTRHGAKPQGEFVRPAGRRVPQPRKGALRLCSNRPPPHESLDNRAASGQYQRPGRVTAGQVFGRFTC